MVHVVASGETWSWNALADAVSHCRTTWLTVSVAPRSTWSHCGSLNVLDQRVPGLPSTAADAGVPAPSTDDAVAGLPWDSRVCAAGVAALAGTAARQHATASRVSSRARRGVRRAEASMGVSNSIGRALSQAIRSVTPQMRGVNPTKLRYRAHHLG